MIVWVVDVRALLQEQVGYSYVRGLGRLVRGASKSSRHQRAGLILGLYVRVCFIVEEKLHNVGVPSVRGPEEAVPPFDSSFSFTLAPD